MLKRHKYRAKKIKIDGILFDSVYESEIYKELKSRFPESGGFSIVVHPHVRIIPEGCKPQPKKTLTWKVDFKITNKHGGEFYVEAKGVFHEVDGYKFLLWNLYQNRPLVVIYSSKTLPRTLQSMGAVEFVNRNSFSVMSREEIVQRTSKPF